MKNDFSITAFFTCLLFSASAFAPVSACTDFLLTTTDGTNIVGRSMEWGLDLHSQIWLHSRDEKRSSKGPTGDPGVAWQSKYGYLSLDCSGLPVAIDGINEEGLSLGSLWLPGTVYQNVGDKPQSAISLLDIGYFILGNCKTVEEAKALIATVRIWSPQLADWGGTPTMHLALHDAQGKSAVVEFLDGQQKIYDNQTHVLTNAPPFEWHRTNLRNYIRLSASNALPLKIGGTILAPPGQGGGFLGIPGDWTPPSRFVRTTAMLGFAKKAKDAPAGVNLALHILNAVDIPLGDVREPDGNLDHSDYTQWIVIKDLTNRVLYFRSYDNLTVRAIDMKRLKFDAGIKPQCLTAIAGGNATIDITTQIKQ